MNNISHLPQFCTINEISIFLKKSVVNLRRYFKIYGIEPIKEKRSGKGRKPFNLYDSFDIINNFIADESESENKDKIWIKRKWDCIKYLKCLDIASRPKYSVWPGMPCEFCDKYEKENI